MTAPQGRAAQSSVLHLLCSPQPGRAEALSEEGGAAGSISGSVGMEQRRRDWAVASDCSRSRPSWQTSLKVDTVGDRARGEHRVVDSFASSRRPLEACSAATDKHRHSRRDRKQDKRHSKRETGSELRSDSRPTLPDLDATGEAGATSERCCHSCGQLWPSSTPGGGFGGDSSLGGVERLRGSLECMLAKFEKRLDQVTLLLQKQVVGDDAMDLVSDAMALGGSRQDFKLCKDVHVCTGLGIATIETPGMDAEAMATWAPENRARQVALELSDADKAAQVAADATSFPVARNALCLSSRDQSDPSDRGRSETDCAEMSQPGLGRGISLSWSTSPKSYLEGHLEKLSMCLIFLNTVFLGIEVELRMDAAVIGAQPAVWLWWMNSSLAAGFAVELCARIALRRCRFFTEDRFWNLFDTMLVLSATVDIILELTVPNFQFFDATVVRCVRAFRLVRSARVLRTVGYIQDLRLMIASIKSSFVSLFWALVLLVILLFMCALLIMMGVEMYILEHGVDKSLLGFFGSLSTTIMSLFMSISGGMDWGELVEPLRKVNPLYLPFFVLFVSFVSFSVVGVLTATIMEASAAILQVDKELVILQTLNDESAKRQHLKELFDDLDVNMTGTLDQTQCRRALQEPEIRALLKLIGVNVAEAENIFRILDRDGNGMVTEQEFTNGLIMNGGVGVATVEEGNRSLAEKMTTLTVALEAALQKRTFAQIASQRG